MQYFSSPYDQTPVVKFSLCIISYRNICSGQSWVCSSLDISINVSIEKKQNYFKNKVRTENKSTISEFIVNWLLTLKTLLPLSKDSFYFLRNMQNELDSARLTGLTVLYYTEAFWYNSCFLSSKLVLITVIFRF